MIQLIFQQEVFSVQHAMTDTLFILLLSSVWIVETGKFKVMKPATMEV